MPDYYIFGGVLRSQLSFPELAPSDTSHPTWQLSRVDDATPVSDLLLMGREDVDAGVQVALYRHSLGARLTFDDTGTFDILDGGRRIDWASNGAPDMDAVRKDVLGRVFAVALAEHGVLTLHGSAVAIGGVAVAFLAPKYHGKSTTAAALVNAGGRLLADDLVPVTSGAGPLVLPSVPAVQLWRDSAARVGTGATTVLADQQAPKLQVGWTSPDRNATSPVPLGAIYLLAPVRADGEQGVRRTRLAGVHAALALLGQAKVAALLGVEGRASLLQRLVELSEKVAVYRLEVPRDFDRLDELTSHLMDWHAPSSADQASETLS